MRRCSHPPAFALLFAWLVSLGPASAVRAQTAPPTPTITTSAELVLVPALVRAPSGDRRIALHASDFLLTDNGEPQSVRLEDAGKQPLAILVLLQTGASGSRHFADYRKLGTMLGGLAAGVPHAIAMVTFDSRPEDQWDFTQYVDDLEDGFVHPGGGDSKAAVLDAVSYGIDLLRKQPPNYRRVLLLISQTRDEGSTTHPEEVVKRLGENNITIECLSFSPEKDWLKDQFTQARQENKPYQYGPNGPLLLHTFNLGKPLGVALSALKENTSATLAAMSGGETLPFATRPELEQQLAALTNDLAAAFTLSFRPTAKQPGFHALQLHVAAHPDLQISARTGYWVAATSKQ